MAKGGSSALPPPSFDVYCFLCLLSFSFLCVHYIKTNFKWQHSCEVITHTAGLSQNFVLASTQLGKYTTFYITNYSVSCSAPAFPHPVCITSVPIFSRITLPSARQVALLLSFFATEQVRLSELKELIQAHTVSQSPR